jgi:hypothetical protein
MSVQNGTKMFTKIKINPNLQFLIKDFKQKVNNKSVNKDRETPSQNLHYVQTETNESSRKMTKKVLNFTGNFKNHSISTSNKLNENSQVQSKHENSISKEKKLFENPALTTIVQTEANTSSASKINNFTKLNNLHTLSDRFNTLSNFFNKNAVETTISSPKLQKLISADKTNTINYRLVKTKLGATKEKKEILFNKNETVFNIDDNTNIKEKIFNFCKRNLFTINEVCSLI